MRIQVHEGLRRNPAGASLYGEHVHNLYVGCRGMATLPCEWAHSWLSGLDGAVFDFDAHVKGGNRRRKAVRLLQRANVHVRNQRADFHHKLARGLVDKYGVIAVEDLNVKGLASGMLSKSVHDAGWSMFVAMLVYKAECAGRRVVKVDPRGTSQTCVCGARVPKTLADRRHECPACGLSAGRDVVSAQVILQRAGTRPSGANVEVVVSCVA